MRLNRIDDPRDNLERARRMELVRFAQANGHSDITNEMPATLIRDKLRERGLIRIPVPPMRVLGAQNVERTPAPEPEIQKRLQEAAQRPVDPAPEDAGRKWKVEVIKPPSEMTMAELRKALSARGISFSRKDKMADLRAKLGENAA